jgi:hypothetical protein
MTYSRHVSRSARTRAYSRVAATLAIAGGLVAATAAGCGTENGVVGGDCAPGYTQCSLTCVDLETDPKNCGACGNVCPPQVACVDGVCGGTLFDGSLYEGGLIEVDGQLEYPDGRLFDSPYATCDGSTNPECRPHHDGSTEDGNGYDDGNVNGDGSGEGGNPGDSSPRDSSGGEGSAGEGGPKGDSSPGDSGNEDSSLPDGCVPPFDTPSNCGTCGNTCVAPNDVCALVDGGFQCTPLCAPPLTDCSGQCVNLLRDPKNCGQCGTVCASQYCFLATCQGVVAGNIMVIGHDFKDTVSSDQEALLLTNSVFYNYSPTKPESVLVFSYEEYADPTVVANGIAILTATGLPMTIKHVTDTTTFTIDSQLTTAGAVLIWDQPTAPPGTLGSLGTAWAPHLSSYVQGGGIVIALDADEGAGEMPALITNAALLNVTGHGTVPSGSVANVPFPLGIARGMFSLYVVQDDTAWFTTSEPMSTSTLYIANLTPDGGSATTQLLAVQKIIN